MFWQGLSYVVLQQFPEKKTRFDKRQKKPSEVISNYFGDPKKNDTTLWVKATGLLIALLNRCISIHSSELRTHWNICRYNNIPDIHII